MLERDTELLRRDVRHHGVAPLPDLAGAAEDGDPPGAVDLHLDARLGHLVRVDRVVRARDVRGAGDAHAAAEGKSSELPGPAARALHGLQALQEAVRGDAQLVDRAGVGADEVAAAELDRVQVDALRELVDLHLEREPGLDRPVAPLRPARRLVGVHARRVEAVRGHRVRSAQQLTRVVRRDEAERRVRPPVEEDLGVHRRELALLRGARAVAHVEGVASPVRVEDLLARVEDLDRPPGDHRELRHAELEVERLALASEGAAHQRLEDPHLRLIQLQHPRQLAVQVVRHLGRGPDGEPADAVPEADRAVRLDRRVRRALEEVLALDDDVRGLHQPVDVPELEVDLLRDVAVPPLPARLVHVRRPAVRLERLAGVQKGRELLVLDPDELQRPVRHVLVDRGHGRHLVADVAHPVDAQRVLVRRPGDDPVRRRHVPPRDDGVHALQRLGAARVDRHDPRVRVGAPEDLAVQHARKRDVVGVDGPTRGLVEPVDLPHGRSNQIQVRL